jgi:hypothetical protein
MLSLHQVEINYLLLPQIINLKTKKMKKILLSIFAIAAANATIAQDTLSQHYATQSFTFYGLDQVAPTDSGYISGNNAYGDLAKVQLMDASVGISGAGTIKGVCLWVANKLGTGNFSVAILRDNAGVPDLTPAGVLGNSTVSLSAVDTSQAGLSLIANGGPVAVLYNTIGMFSTPVAIPATNKFWISVILPTGGSEMALVQNNYTTAPYAASLAHVGEIWSDLTYHAIADPMNWGATALATFAMFPIVQFTAALDEASFVTGVYPNPTSTVLNITSKEVLASINVISLDGKVVATSTSSEVNVANLASGVYTYQAVTVSGKVANGKFTKN